MSSGVANDQTFVLSLDESTIGFGTGSTALISLSYDASGARTGNKVTDLTLLELASFNDRQCGDGKLMGW